MRDRITARSITLTTNQRCLTPRRCGWIWVDQPCLLW